MVVGHPPKSPSLSRGLVGHDSASSNHQVCPEGWLIETLYPLIPSVLFRGLFNRNSTSTFTSKSVLRVGYSW
jgi:hypothetical protein